MSLWEKSLGIFSNFGGGNQWEEENILGLEEFGEMMEEKWRERHDWVEVSRITLEMEEFGKDVGKSRKERDDW
jgi:hypothetical protein